MVRRPTRPRTQNEKRLTYVAPDTLGAQVNVLLGGNMAVML